MTDPNTERTSLFSQLNQLVANRSWLGVSRASLISRQKIQVGCHGVYLAALGLNAGVAKQIQLMHRPTRFGSVRA